MADLIAMVAVSGAGNSISHATSTKSKHARDNMGCVTELGLLLELGTPQDGRR